RLDEPGHRDAGLSAEGQTFGEQQVDAHRQGVVDDLRDRSRPEFAHPHDALRERVEDGLHPAQYGFVAAHEERDLPGQSAFAAPVKRRVQQVGAARLQRLTDFAHHAGRVGGGTEHHRAGLHAFPDAASPERHLSHLGRTLDADADHVGLRGHVPRRFRPRRPAFQQRRRGRLSQVVNNEGVTGRAYEARERLSHVPETDETHSHRFLHAEIQGPMTAAHYTAAPSESRSLLTAPAKARARRRASTTRRGARSMRIGVVFPQTEIGSDPAVIRDYTQAAEAAGYDHLLVFDHVLGATLERLDRLGRRPPYTDQSSFHEPFVLFGYLRACTQRPELVTGIVILPQRQTALVAKQAAAVDVLTRGRLRLGVGIGWNYTEYESLNEDFHTRGRRVGEQITVMRKLWTEPLVSF